MAELNYSTIALLLGENVRTVSVRFFRDNGAGSLHSKCYTYKTTFNFEPGDLAVVAVGNLFKVVSVVEMDVPADQDDIDYKWVVCAVDTAGWLANVEAERKLCSTVRAKHDAHRKRQLVEALMGDDGVKAIEFK